MSGSNDWNGIAVSFAARSDESVVMIRNAGSMDARTSATRRQQVIRGFDGAGEIAKSPRVDDQSHLAIAEDG